MVLYDVSLGGGGYPLLHETLSEMKTTVIYNATKLSLMVDIWNFILPKFGEKYKKIKILNKFWIHTPPFHTYTLLLGIK